MLITIAAEFRIVRTPELKKHGNHLQNTNREMQKNDKNADI